MPAGVEHCPRADHEAHILLIEREARRTPATRTPRRPRGRDLTVQLPRQRRLGADRPPRDRRACTSARATTCCSSTPGRACGGWSRSRSCSRASRALDVVLSHWHLDHVAGLGFLTLHDAGVEPTVWAPGRGCTAPGRASCSATCLARRSSRTVPRSAAPASPTSTSSTRARWRSVRFSLRVPRPAAALDPDARPAGTATCSRSAPTPATTRATPSSCAGSACCSTRRSTRPTGPGRPVALRSRRRSADRGCRRGRTPRPHPRQPGARRRRRAGRARACALRRQRGRPRRPASGRSLRRVSAAAERPARSRGGQRKRQPVEELDVEPVRRRRREQ